MKDFLEFTEKSDFQSGVHENPIHCGWLPKKGGVGQFADLGRGGGGAWQERGGGVFFEGVGLIPQCTLCVKG